MSFLEPKIGTHLYTNPRRSVKRILIALVGGILGAVALAIFLAAISQAAPPPPPPPPPPTVISSISGTLADTEDGLPVSSVVAPYAYLSLRRWNPATQDGRDFFWISLPQTPPPLP